MLTWQPGKHLGTNAILDAEMTMMGQSPVYDPIEYHRRVLAIARNVARDGADVPTIAPRASDEATLVGVADASACGTDALVNPTRSAR